MLYRLVHILDITFIILDTCADVGQIFDKGDFFKCADNANNCQCSNNNRVKSTRKNASVKEMCLDDLRKAAKP